MTQRTRSVSTVDETIMETIINRMMPQLTEKFNEGIERLEKKIDSMEENMNGIVSKLSRLEGLVENMKISIIDLEKTKNKSFLGNSEEVLSLSNLFKEFDIENVINEATRVISTSCTLVDVPFTNPKPESVIVYIMVCRTIYFNRANSIFHQIKHLKNYLFQ
ncbi:hypothetical protein JTB14_027983 [Gonioctena quinquepunctata]|nr:hypothetical protein JTB14_027983 [Gonioctena quinquepunctata]